MNNVNTLILDRRNKKRAEIKAQIQGEYKARMKRAYKAIGLDENTPIPANQQVVILRNYIAGLQTLQAELMDQFGDRKEFISIRMEIGKALEQLTKLGIEEVIFQTHPGARDEARRVERERQKERDKWGDE